MICTNENEPKGTEKKYGEFAKMYAKEIKAVSGANNWFLYGYPTLREVVMGLYAFFCQLIEQEIKDRAQEFRK